MTDDALAVFDDPKYACFVVFLRNHPALTGTPPQEGE